jgi:hypothetical protein
MLDDGRLPEGRVAIERICYGRVWREAHTDSQGAFAFQLGMNNNEFQDASVGNNDMMRSQCASGSSLFGASPGSTPLQAAGVTTRDLMSCELRASLPGYWSDSIRLAGRQLHDNPDVGTIVLHRSGAARGGATISATTLKAPREASKALERARSAAAKSNLDAAIKDLKKAVAVYPQFAEALSMLGELYVAKGNTDDATHVLQQAIEADPNYVPPMIQLALLAGRQRDWKRMQELSDKALGLDGYDYPAAYYYGAVANYNLNNAAAAEKNARAARRLDSQYRFPRIDLLLANILADRADYTGAAEQLRSFLKHQPTGKDADAARETLSQMEQKIAAGPAPEQK